MIDLAGRHRNGDPAARVLCLHPVEIPFFGQAQSSPPSGYPAGDESPLVHIAISLSQILIHGRGNPR
jgi:hypothetical protein